MRLKQRPEDFRVRELLEYEEAANGEYYLHLLRKEKLSTHEALSEVARLARVDRADIAYAGLKDRQAITEQYISVRGQQVSIDARWLRVKFQARIERPVTSKMSAGNAFRVTVRDLSPTEAAQVRRDLPSLQRTGFPNYFDDQRFGCLRHGQGFAMQQILRGDYEQALKQLIASPSPAAITGDVKLKRILQQRWGDWEACRDLVRGPVYTPVFKKLVERPDDFRSALQKLPTRTRLIHAFAFQSHLWNRALSRMVKPWVPAAKRLQVDTLSGRLCAWRYLDPGRERQLLELDTPLYGPDGGGGSGAFRTAMADELAAAGLRREDFLAHEVPGMVLKEESRQAMIKPGNLELQSLGRDDCNAGRMMVVLAFELPRGAYASMMIKRLFARPWLADRRPREDRPPSRRHGGGRS